MPLDTSNLQGIRKQGQDLLSAVIMSKSSVYKKSIDLILKNELSNGLRKAELALLLLMHKLNTVPTIPLIQKKGKSNKIKFIYDIDGDQHEAILSEDQYLSMETELSKRDDKLDQKQMQEYLKKIKETIKQIRGAIAEAAEVKVFKETSNLIPTKQLLTELVGLNYPEMSVSVTSIFHMDLSSSSDSTESNSSRSSKEFLPRGVEPSTAEFDKKDLLAKYQMLCPRRSRTNIFIALCKNWGSLLDFPLITTQQLVLYKSQLHKVIEGLRVTPLKDEEKNEKKYKKLETLRCSLIENAKSQLTEVNNILVKSVQSHMYVNLNDEEKNKIFSLEDLKKIARYIGVAEVGKIDTLGKLYEGIKSLSKNPDERHPSAILVGYLRSFFSNQLSLENFSKNFNQLLKENTPTYSIGSFFSSSTWQKYFAMKKAGLLSIGSHLSSITAEVISNSFQESFPEIRHNVASIREYCKKRKLNLNCNIFRDLPEEKFKQPFIKQIFNLAVQSSGTLDQTIKELSKTPIVKTYIIN